MIDAEDIGGTWYMSGNEDKPCRIQPRGRDRAIFTNEHGDSVEGYVRGNLITVPKWNLTARIEEGTIRWSNRSIWTR